MVKYSASTQEPATVSEDELSSIDNSSKPSAQDPEAPGIGDGDVNNGLNADGTNSEEQSEKTENKEEEDWFEFLAEWIIDLISLAEAVFTTVYFDEDRFGFSVLLLVFTLFPVADSIVKGIATCTDTIWDDYVIDFISEGFQAFLFLYYCSFSELSIFWIPMFMACQVFLKFIIHFREWWNKEPGPVSEDDRCNNIWKGCYTGFSGSCIALQGCLQAFLLLFWQDDSPFRTKKFEITIAVFTWFTEVFSVNRPLKYKDYPQKIITDCIGLGYGIYMYYLCWSWWFSPDIRETFDKVFTMFGIVASVVMTAGLCCRCIQLGNNKTARK